MTDFAGESPAEVMHGLHYDDARGGIVASLRNLQAVASFGSILGVNEKAGQGLFGSMPTVALPGLRGEANDLRAVFEARRCAIAVRAWLKAGPSRVYHGHSRAGLLVACWLRILGEHRVVATVHVLGKSKRPYRLASRLLGSSLYWLNPAVREHYGIRGEGWDGCLPDCVPDESFQAGGNLSHTGDAFVVLCAGTLARVKQWELAIEALAALPPGSPVRIIHAGGEAGSAESTRYALAIRRLVQNRGLGERFTWLGEQKSLAAPLEGADCFLSPSRWEASSMAALEALAAGVPVIAADQSGTRVLVEESGAGALFQSDDPKSLALALEAAAARRGPPVEGQRLERYKASAVAQLHAAAYSRVLRVR